MSLGFTPLGDRVVIQADVDDRAPVETASGVVLAKTMAAAVVGNDAEMSWFVGTVVACGPLVTHFDTRKYIQRRLAECGDWLAAYKSLSAEFDALPRECPDPLHVGDRVTFSWAAGQQLTIDGTKYLILRASDVLAVLESEDA